MAAVVQKEGTAWVVTTGRPPTVVGRRYIVLVELGSSESGCEL